MIAVDTSVAVAAALPWHEAHSTAVAALPPAKSSLLAQVAVETYSVLTRLPPRQRVAPDVAAEYLRRSFALPPLTLSGRGYGDLLELAARDGLAGGAVYDAVVGATAREAGATLLTLDRRALATYRLLGVEHRLLV